MPPSRHSSSSHASRSSSSRSSSSRSSGSSYRRPSSHSSSSYSSSSCSSSSSRSSFFGIPGKGPSRHSGSSWGSNSASGSAFQESARPREAAWRPRVNQPTGFVETTHMRPTYYYGRKHSYAYYPLAWVDANTGVSYEKGYYDENGQRYDNVAFEENGRYKGVVCHCPYCGQDTILDLGVGDVGVHSLKCEHCGGPMEISSELDAILKSKTGNTHIYAAEESLKNAFPKKQKKSRLWLIIPAALLLFGLGKKLQEEKSQPFGGNIQQITIVENNGKSGSSVSPAFNGNAVFLEKQADGGYHVVTDVIRADKILYFDRDADSYYDETADCWLWYNTDVEPAVWQYWVEGISSDYGDYGWMEHDASGWYIEQSQGNWTPLPDEYSTDLLWWIG